MRIVSCIYLALLFVTGAAAAAQEKSQGAPAEFYGKWSGSWEGMGSSGGFELTLEKPTEKAAGGRVAVSGEPAYKAELKTLAFDGNKLTATYEFPPDPQLEVELSATFESGTAKGGWIVREKAGASEVASGTWTVSRK